MKAASSGVIAAVAVLLAVGASVPAQMGFTAPPDAMDTLSGGSVGGPGSSFDPIARARGAAGAASADPFAATDPFGAPPAADPFGAPPAADPFGAPAGGANPFGAPTADPFGAGAAPFGAPADPFGGANPFGAPAGGFGAPTVAASIPTLSAWAGERIVCKRTGQILQDAREINILVSAAGQYYDDGQSGNDARAGDNIYTNITVNDNFISPEAHLVKTKLIQTLQYASALSPMQFTQVRVATTEPISPLPKMTELETSQDAALKEWAMRFLRDYRVNPEEMGGEFYPTYMPPPPRAPNIPLPATFNPEAQADEVGPNGLPLPAGFPAGGQFAGDPGFAADPAAPGANSRYF